MWVPCSAVYVNKVQIVTKLKLNGRLSFCRRTAETWEARTPAEELPPSDWPVGMGTSVVAFS